VTRERGPKAPPAVAAQSNCQEDTPAGSAVEEAALEYVARGLPVFPCRGKRPLTDRGFKDATTDPAVVRWWWSKWPTANIAIPTGDSTFHCLDIDDIETMRAVVHEHGRPPRGPTVHTPSGEDSWHCYFAAPSRPVGNRARFVDGCDWRGNGGYVIVPPSVGANGKRYVWGRDLDVPLSPVPDWLLDLHDPPRPSMPARRAVARGSHYAEAALDAEVRDVANAPVGCRNDTLNRASFNVFTLVAAGLLDLDATLEELYAAGRRAGLTDKETAATIASGMRAGLVHPREVKR
jgi:hypothetical protein